MSPTFQGVERAAVPGLLSADDRRRVLEEWNHTASDLRADATLQDLFAEAVTAQGAEPAVLHDGGAPVTYRELDARSNQLARRLVSLGVGPDVPVAVLLGRTPELIVSLLGILKSGAPYLPLEPRWPRERLALVLEDSGAPLVVTEVALAGALPDGTARLLVDADAAAIAAERTGAVDAGTSSADLAYILYTSGSTGRPKGVMVEHRALTRLVRGADYADLSPRSTVLHAISLAFDPSGLEIWGALLNGGRLVLHSEEVLTPRGLAEVIRRHGVTTVVFATPVFNAVIDEDPCALVGLREVIVGGEAMSASHARRAQAAAPDLQIVNAYGPTECTVITTCHRVSQAVQRDARSIPIGRPIRDTTVYVVDADLRPLAIGEPGELVVGGARVARGYLRRPELTAERFVPDPFSAKPDARLYRTGDLVRWREDGTLEFLGRIDAQVKIRGIRIEPGEIEAALMAHPAVRSAVVVAREDVPSQKRLVAYLLPRSGAEPAPHGALRAFLASLPEAMVPSAYVWLEALPMTSNGKLDRRALPAPAPTRPALSVEYIAPASPLERLIAALWSDLLQVEPVGRNDGFFELGGSSLQAVKMVARVRAELGADVPVVKLFADPRLSAFAAAASDATATPAPRTAPAPEAQGVRSEPVSSGAIAIVGMAGRFPGAADTDQLWRNLLGGVDAVTEFRDGLDPSIPEVLRRDPAYVAVRGIFDGYDLFDAGFFGMTAREADILDPQNRVLLEVAWEALERSGHVPSSFTGAIGVFAGKMNDSYHEHNVSTRPDLVRAFGELNTIMAHDKDFVATRIAFKLDLTGPALSVYTACSTSLVAVSEAVESLRRGACDLALAGGASLTVPVRSGHVYQEGAMLSADGRTRAFDARGSGTIFSDGAAMVALRRLEDALRDGDTIYAVIRGAAVNNDGARRASFTAPSVEGQAAVIARAHADARVDPRTIGFVEAHGTATPLGDPIEVEALTRAFRRGTGDRGFCALGSVKSNVGHLVSAAGAAGLIKASLALHEETIPPTVHFHAPNPNIDFESTPFWVPARVTPWPRGGSPRRAGVSSFGFGGTNAHVVLEEAPPLGPTTPGRPREALLVSARSPAALDAACARLAAHLRDAPGLSLADVAHTLQAGRARFAHRRAVVAASLAEAAALLAGDPRSHAARKVDAAPPPLAFAFPGQGAQYVGMGENLYRTEPVFREALDRACAAIRSELPRDLREVLHPAQGREAEAEAALRQTTYTQPALFAVEHALARLWMSWGIAPAAMIGHSVGEFVCAALAGVLGPDDAARLVAIRGRIMQEQPPGAMLSVGLGAADAARRLSDPSMAVASDNAPGSCVVAGPEAAIAALEAELAKEGVAARRLHTSHAFHSPMMDAAVPAFLAHLRDTPLSPPRIPFVSTATGTWITDAQATDPSYWARHLRETVRFGEGVRAIWQEPRILLEVGPRTTLTTLSRRQAKDPARHVAVASLADTAADDAEWTALLGAAGQLWTAGVELDWPAFRARERRRRVVLPTYPFERKRHWIEPAPQRIAAPAPAGAHVNGAASHPTGVVPPASVASTPALTVSAPVAPSPRPAMPDTTRSSRVDRIASAICALFEEVSGTDISDAAPTATFVEMGMDSLFLTQVALQVQKRFGVKVTFRELMEKVPTVGALAAHLDGLLPPDAFAEAIPQDGASSANGTTGSSDPGAISPTSSEAFMATSNAAQMPALPAPSPYAPWPAPQQAYAAGAAAAPPWPLPFPGFPPPYAPMFPDPRFLGAYAAMLALAPYAGGAPFGYPWPPQPGIPGPMPTLPPLAPPVAAPAPAGAPPPVPAVVPAVQPAAAASPQPAASPPSPRAAAGGGVAVTAAAEDPASQAQKYNAKQAFGAMTRIHLADEELTPRQRARLEAFVKRYVARTKTSKRLTQENRVTLADPRVVSGFKPTIKELVYQIVVERSRGSRLWDVDGNEYVDCLNGFGASYFGWQPEFVQEAVRQQLERGYDIGPMTPLAYDVARLVCELTGMERAGFCNTGSEAVLGCMRIARTVTGRSLIASFNGSYHGICDEVIVRGTKKLKAVPAAPGIVASTAQNMLVLDYGTPESLEILRQRAGELAAVLVEPVQSRHPEVQPREFLHAVRELTRKAGAALIFDEVITGFRIRQGGAQEFYGVQADVASYGKVVGGGFPLGIIAGRRPWMDALDGGPWQYGDDSTPTAGVTYFAGTFCRHPLALAAAKAVLEYLKAAGPALQEAMNAKTAKLAADLNAVFKASGAPLECRQASALWKVLFTEERPYQELLFPVLRDRGLHILEGFGCFLTLAHTEADIAFILKAFRDGIAEMQEAGFFPEPQRKPAIDAAAPPVPGARLGRDADGQPAWFIENPEHPGKYLRVGDA